MALYKCKVIDECGNKKTIKVDGYSNEEIINKLKNIGFIIVNINEDKNIFNRNVLSKQIGKIKLRELYIFCSQMQYMLKAGINIVSCIEILKFQTENRKFKRVLFKIHEELQMGSTFSKALSSYKVFPDLLITMAEAGETNGKIEDVMKRLSSHFEKEYKIQNKVKSAMTYPAILSIVSTSVVLFLLTKVIPTFVELYSSFGISLPFSTRILLHIGDFTEKRWQLLLMIFITACFLIYKVCRTEKVRINIDYAKLIIPIYKTLTMKLCVSRFARTLSSLTGSSVPMLESLDKVSNIVGNSYVKNLIITAKKEVQNGSSLSNALQRLNIFPPMVCYMIKIGEETDSLSELLDKTAEIYDGEVENSLQKLITMIEPIMIIVMAAIIGFIVIAMVTPMFDMVRIVQ